jgi:trigger factor
LGPQHTQKQGFAMNITLKETAPLQATVTIDVVADDYRPQVEKALKDYRKNASVPGFRKGMVPEGLVRKQYGKAIMIDEVNKLLNDNLYRFLEEQQISLLGNPVPVPQTELNWEEGAAFAFDFEIGKAPEVQVELSSKDKITYVAIQVDASFVDEQIAEMRNRYGKMSNPETAAAGDYLYGSFVREGMEAKNGTIRLSAVADASALKSLLALKEGENLTVNMATLFDQEVVKPELVLGMDEDQFNAGSPEFTFTLERITRIEPADLNQELFDKIYGEGVVTSEAELRSKIEAEMNQVYIKDTDRKFVNDVAEYLLAKVKVDLPAAFLKKWLQTSGDKPLSAEEAEAEYARMEMGLKWQLIENAIIRSNNLRVTHEELHAYAEELVRSQLANIGQAGLGDDQIKNIAHRLVHNEKEAERLNEELYNQKMLQFYKDNMTVTTQQVTVEEFVKLLSKQNG